MTLSSQGRRHCNQVYLQPLSS